MELGARHPHAAGALIVGSAYPDFAASGLRQGMRAFLGVGEAGTPDFEHIDAILGESARFLKSMHPGADEQWEALVQQSAPMWLDYEGLTDDEVGGIEAPTLVFTGDRDDQVPLDLMVSLYKTLPNAELAVCPHADHLAPIGPERASIFASMIRDFAGRLGEP